jgi:hypothetical protein
MEKVHLDKDPESGEYVGTITCAGRLEEEQANGKKRVVARCGAVIPFLPDDGHLPEHFLDPGHPQYSVNHAGCAYALDPENGETINVIDPAEVVAFFQQKPTQDDSREQRKAKEARNRAYEAAVKLKADRDAAR